MRTAPLSTLPLETGALSLRLPVDGDAAQITRFLQDYEIVKMLGRVPWPYGEADARWWINNAHEQAVIGQEYVLVIIHADHGLIGSCGLQKTPSPDDLSVWELGYWIGRSHWRQGLVSLAARAILDWGRDVIGATGFVSGHIEGNEASGHVLRKLGFEEVGTIEHYARGRDRIVRARRFVKNTPAQLALAFENQNPRPNTD
ncbi:MAG: GNAT family N-acetyltransferase [Pseudomonadota bacterium]